MLYIKTIFAFLLIIICNTQQLSAQYSLDTTVVDYNNDKILDTLITDFSTGSTFGGTEYTIINGNTNEKYKLGNFGCYCSLRRITLLDKNLTVQKNKSFLTALKDLALPKKSDSIDHSLQWMISAEFNYKALDDHPFYDYIISPKTHWQKQPLEIPESYYIEISGDTLQKFIGLDKDNPITKNTKGYLSYYTFGHRIKELDTLTPVTQNKIYTVYKTPHAVFVKKGDRYKWVFISDSRVTGSPDRSSWFSMSKVKLIDKYLIIHQDMPPDNVYNIQIVNIETQRVGRLHFRPSQNNGTDQGGMKSFEIKNDSLRFNEYDEQKIEAIPLKQLFEALDIN